FFQKLVQRVVHALAREGVDFKALDTRVFAIGGGNGHAVDDAFGNAVGAVGRHAHGNPLAVAAQHPVADVVDGGVGGRCGRRQAARVDDGRAALAHRGDEGVAVPGVVIDELGQALAFDRGEADIGIHGGRVVAPHDEFLDVGHALARLGGQLGEGAVVVQAQHGGEVLGGQVGGRLHGDVGVGVGGVADHQHLDVAAG